MAKPTVKDWAEQSAALDRATGRPSKTPAEKAESRASLQKGLPGTKPKFRYEVTLVYGRPGGLFSPGSMPKERKVIVEATTGIGAVMKAERENPDWSGRDPKKVER